MSLPYFATHYCITAARDEASPAQFFEALVPDWDYIRDTLEKLQTPQDTIEEKSRQMLGSWLGMVTALHDFLFYAGGQDLLLSRKEDLVDDGTWNSLMGKVRFMVDRLPPWLRPEMTRDHDRYMRLVNPNNGAILKGESTNSNAARGGTWRRVIADEFAFVPRSYLVLASVHNSCPAGKLLISTPFGMDNAFAWVRHQPNQAGYQLIELDWSLRPDRDEAWYLEQKAKLPPDQLAREVDRSYEDSVAGKFYGFLKRSTQLAPVEYDPAYPVYRGYDFGVGAPTTCVWVQKTPLGPRVLDYLELADTSDRDIVDAIMSRHLTDGVGWGLGDVHGDYGDPAGKNRQSDLSSWFSQFEDLSLEWAQAHGVGTPIRLRTKHNMSLGARQKHGWGVLRHAVVDSVRGIGFWDVIASRRKPVDEQGRPQGNLPKEDWTKHGCDAFEYIAANVYPVHDAQVERVPSRPRAVQRERATVGLMSRRF